MVETGWEQWRWSEVAALEIHSGVHDYSAVGLNLELREREKSKMMSWVLT